MDYRKELAKWGYNKGNSIDVEILIDEILPSLFSQQERMYSEEPKPTIKQVDYVAKKQERMYSEEDMRKAYDQGIDDSFDIGFSNKDDANFNEFIEQFKKK